MGISFSIAEICCCPCIRVCSLNTATYNENKKRNKDKTNIRRIILSFLGACKILLEINPLIPLWERRITTSFLGLHGPACLGFGFGMKTFLGLHGPDFFLFGILLLLGIKKMGDSR